MTTHLVWRSLIQNSIRDEDCLLRRHSAFCAYLSSKSHAPRPETFFSLLENCKDFLRAVFQSAQPDDVLLGIRALEDALTIKHILGDDFLKQSLSLLCDLIKASEDERVARRAAEAIGVFISKSGGALSNSIVDQVVWALNCLEGESVSHEKLNAVILLRSVAEQAPAAFNIHVHKFLNLIWKGLTAPELSLRTASAEAVGACLCVIEQRKTRNRVIWFNKLANEALMRLRSRQDVPSIHGSFMVISRLVQYSGEFMLARYEEVTRQTLLPRLPEDRHVNRVILDLIPLLADFCPERFLEEHLNAAVNTILAVTRDGCLEGSPEEEIASFHSLKGLALCLNEMGSEMSLWKWMPEIAKKLMHAFEEARDAETHREVLECCGVLAECFGSHWKSYAEQLLMPMIMTGISHPLANCLQQTLESVPELAQTIHERLLDVIYLLLIDAPYTDTLPLSLQDSIRGFRCAETITTAMEVLSFFDFGELPLLDFTLDHICRILSSHETCRVRGAAAAACLRLARTHVRTTGSLDSVKPLLEAVSIYGMSDPKECVRFSFWKTLLECSALDTALLNCPTARLLYIGLGDVSMEVQLAALKVAGRLIQAGGHFVEESIMEVLTQLMQQLQLSFDKERNQIMTEVLSQLIQSCPSVVHPRADSIAQCLIKLLKRQLQPPKTEASSSQEHRSSALWLRERFSWTSTGLVAAALETAGHLADQAGAVIDADSLQTLMHLTVAALQKVEIETDSIEAVKTLGKIVSSTGAVDQPYHQFSWLLDRLLDMLQVDDAEVRTVVTRTLGVLSAIDPSTQRRIQAHASGEGRLELEGVRPVKKAQDESMSGYGGRSQLDKGSTDLLMISKVAVNSEESYSLFAMNALLKVLKQHSLSPFHRDAIRVLGSITSSLPVSSVQYLNTLVPNWCEAVYSGDEEMKHYILQQFIRLVRVVKQHIRHFLKHLMKLIQDLWSDDCSEGTLSNLLLLTKEVAGICPHDLQSYALWLVPRFVQLMETGAWTLIPVTLETIVAFGPALQSYFHQILPRVAQLLMSRGISGLDEIYVAILSFLEELSPSLCVPEVAAGVLMPLLQILHQNETLTHQEKMTDVTASLIFAARLDSHSFRRLSSFLHHKGSRSRKLAVLSTHVYPKRAHSPIDLELNGAWRTGFERPVQAQIQDVTEDPSARRGHFSDRDLRHVWNAEQRYTYQDWLEWMRVFSLELLRSSPSPALRACHEFAQYIPTMSKDLFSASFVSCWSELTPGVQREFIRHLEAAMASSTIPPEILTTLLNLAEFMEHNSYQLPLDKRTLAALSMKCQAFAKALHYKEMEFQDSPERAVENMLAIYNQCFLPAAADGLLAYSRDVLKMEIKDSWYEKLHKWDRALAMYEQRSREPLLEIEQSIEANLGRMRCYSALWDWPNLSALCRSQWVISDPTVRKQIAPLAAQAAWKMGHWEEMSHYLEAVDVDEDNTSDASTCAFLCSVNKIHQQAFEEGQHFIDRARQFLSADLAALSGESYDRAYEKMVRVQQLAELEEVVHVMQSQASSNTERAERIVHDWKTRLEAVQKRADVWESCLSVRSLVLTPEEDILTWMKFAAMCRKQDKPQFAKSFLLDLLGYDPMTIPRGEVGYGGGSRQPEAMFAFLKHIFGTSEGNPEIKFDAIERLTDMIQRDLTKTDAREVSDGLEVVSPSVPLISRAYVTLAKWRLTCSGYNLTPDHIEALIEMADRACRAAPDWAKAWRDWAVYHLIAVEHYSENMSDLASKHVAPAVHGFFKALHLSQDSALSGGMLGSGPSKDTYQDILRLLTLWFSHGDAPNVIDELTTGFNMVRIETWIVVIPQIIARIYMKANHVQDLIHQLLKKIGQSHPQALLYPILVASYNASGGRRAASLEALDLMRLTFPQLVNEGELIGRRFADIAVFWDEKWHESLEEASKYYFTESDVDRMLEVLLPLHRDLQTLPATTNSERRFVANYAEQLNEAYGLLMKYQEQEDDATIQKAWDIYYSVFRKIDRSIRDMMVLHLSDVAPDLQNRCWTVAIPGTYSPFQTEQVCIDKVVPEIQVLNTKQRPRKLTIEGTDGNRYIFLLKGHEDLRQDERVMQLFGLVNTILASDFESSERELSIARYAVTPLSPNMGLIGWVPNCDTLHALIKEYREVKGIPINSEHQMMKNLAPNCENLTLIQKVEVFRHALDCTAGDDLKNIMWMKSSSSEHWLAHRTNYIRSCAVMSIVGYFLGLGDRHPSNLMIDRYSGKLVHIDFGDCFEAGMNREKFPEKVPFRLTRMMIKAMEVAGVEGTFRRTCEMVMHVLRAEKLTVMAMLEAFVYDPLISWRLAYLPTAQDADSNLTGDVDDILNARALQVTNRIKLKLSGRELDPDGPGLSVNDQVRHLIKEATSHVNLCQAYIGWCPFW